MGARELKQFQSAQGRKAITDWRRGLLPGRRAVMDIFLKRLVSMNDWPSGTCNPIRGFPGCKELRWTAEKVEHRIFGFFDSTAFVMIVGCTHKGAVYTPPGAFQTLRDKMGKLNRGEATICDYAI